MFCLNCLASWHEDAIEQVKSLSPKGLKDSDVLKVASDLYEKWDISKMIPTSQHDCCLGNCPCKCRHYQ